ncbi:hypothetical protein QYB59_001653 [Clostridium perfringens]|nr:hypothetical protein [Clostridium perfringens]
MSNIVIISKIIVSAIPNPFSMDVELNFFKKSLSQILKDKLNKRLTQENMNYVMFVDCTYDDCEKIIKEVSMIDATSLLLISPYIKDKIRVSDSEKKNYYILSEKEFNYAYIEDIINYIKNF